MVDHVAHPENVGSRHTSEGRHTNMKSWLAFGLCAVGMGVLVSTVEQGYADENDRATTCTLATLKGRYLFALHGTLLPPAFGVTEPTESDAAGFHIFNGNGTGGLYGQLHSDQWTKLRYIRLAQWRVIRRNHHGSTRQ
jgi:hypothetical protein